MVGKRLILAYLVLATIVLAGGLFLNQIWCEEAKLPAPEEEIEAIQPEEASVSSPIESVKEEKEKKGEDASSLEIRLKLSEAIPLLEKS
ncbi:MAG: hypothetical protein WC658_03525 [Candidatus Omnitrophota bacterium]